MIRMQVRTRVAALAAATALTLSMGMAMAHGDDLNDLTKRLESARDKASTTKSQLSDVTADLEDSDAEMAAAYTKLQETQAQIPVAQAEVDKADAEYEIAQRDADEVADKLQTAKDESALVTTQIADNKKRAEQARQGVAQMARQAAKGDYGLTTVELIVGAQSLDDVITEYNLSQTALRTESSTLLELREANAVATNMQVRLEASQASIKQLQTQATAKVTETKTTRQAAVDARSALTALETEQKAATAKIAQRRAAEQAKQDELEKQSSSLTSDIQDLIGLTKAEKARLAREKAAREKKEREEAEKSGSGSSSGSGSGSSGGGKTTNGFLAYPTKVPYVTSGYGMRFHPILHYWRLHAGTDFRAYCGTPVYAAAAGTVEWARMRSGYGNQVMINHGTVGGKNLMTSYNHLSRFAVSSGEKVKKGELIAYSGSTGTSTACHLHFEVYKNGQTVNPLSMY